MHNLLRKFIVRSNQFFAALMWFFFAFLDENAPIIKTLEVEYSKVYQIFEISFIIAGVLLLVSIFKTEMLFPAFVFSSFVATGAFMATLGVSSLDSSPLFPAMWALIMMISITQSIKSFYGWCDNGA